MREPEARKQLTDQQRRILDYLREYIASRGFPPTVREIGEGVGLASTSTVHGHLQRLAEKGYIRRDPAKPRTIEIVGEGVPERPVWFVPVVGRVAAGPLTHAEMDVEEHVPVAPDFVRADPSELFFLRVRGDSMILAGIHDGDLLLVRRQAHARDGEIIVAMVEGEATVKRIYRERSRIRLQPENPYMDPIYVTDMQVVGKVAAVVRRMA